MSKVITAAKQVWSAKDQITRNIWLAGLGAYDKGYESASNTVTKSQSIFDELVERGRKLEADTTQTITSNKEKLASVSQTATDAIQGKVQTAVATFTHIDANTFDNIIDKIDQIEKALADAKTEQQQPVVEKVEVAVTEKVTAAAKEVTAAVEKVEIAVTEKVAAVAEEVTTVVETVADAATKVASTLEKEITEEAAPVKAKKVTKRVKKAAKKKQQ